MFRLDWTLDRCVLTEERKQNEIPVPYYIMVLRRVAVLLC